jgi:putative membrane protein
MIYYNSKDWIKPILHFHRFDTFQRLLPALVFLGLLTLGVHFLEVKYLKLEDDDNALISNLPVMHSLLGFAMSLLLVFRTNSAYDRWWEGRKLWGSLVNNLRNLAIKLDTWLPPENLEDRIHFRKWAGLFPTALKNHLLKPATEFALDEQAHPELEGLAGSSHVPMKISQTLHDRLMQLQASQVITQYQLLMINAEMQSLMDICGACERIKNTPIPYSYSSFIKKFIVAYTFTLPFGFVFTLDLFAIPVVMFIFYVMASLELIAESIEDPFGTDSTDLPMDKLANAIREDVHRTIRLPRQRPAD